MRNCYIIYYMTQCMNSVELISPDINAIFCCVLPRDAMLIVLIVPEKHTYIHLEVDKTSTPKRVMIHSSVTS